ncbi:MAG: cobalt-precorrin-5B (C(1))-methyltransferase CbiD [Syntrophobacteraceae bacterium]|nr:cobalt-precorrin-5B (C(1))-methyltransferase CbiD [Syntrophobacteraceae bacterium]
MADNASQGGGAKGPPALRSGFSTGTAATAAAVAALRGLITGNSAEVVAVRLPSAVYLAVPVAVCSVHGESACASVIKDGGDDPDVTNGAEIRARVRVTSHAPGKSAGETLDGPQIIVSAGRGIGMVTKPGLPALPGEPAINPVPRRMISENITLELLRFDPSRLEELHKRFRGPAKVRGDEGKPALRLPFYSAQNHFELLSAAGTFSVLVKIEAPRGEELALRTLNPRLGITGGISILGTTGIVRPFSHEAYEQTIQAAFSVAASNCAGSVVLSTGGKSERFAKLLLPTLRPEAFVQIADFFSFAVREAIRFGFQKITHSVFFGKAVKMAVGHPYTHAHSAPMDLEFLAATARSLGHDEELCAKLALANTARHALDILADKGAHDIVEAIAREAASQSARLAGRAARIRLFLFDYDGKLLADVSQKEMS